MVVAVSEYQNWLTTSERILKRDKGGMELNIQLFLGIKINQK